MPKKYDVLLSDCPWEYDNRQTNDPKRGGITYPILSMNELAALPMYKAMNDNSILIYWVTFPKLIDRHYKGSHKHNPLSIIDAWGFTPVTALFIWIKTNKKGAAIYEDDNLEVYDNYYSGLGRYTNSNAEVAIVARRGKGLPRMAKNVKQLIFAPIGIHSAKPSEQYNRIDQLYGNDIQKLEIFARKVNPPPNHYDATGLDYDGIDIKDWIKQYE